jgi:hypothetical protein
VRFIAPAFRTAATKAVRRGTPYCNDKSGQTPMLLSIFRWSMFLWGCLALCGMSYYASQSFPRIDDITANELMFGFALSALYGWPAWLSLPVLAIVSRKSLSRLKIVLLLAPVLLAALLFVISLFLSDGA